MGKWRFTPRRGAFAIITLVAISNSFLGRIVSDESSFAKEHAKERLGNSLKFSINPVFQQEYDRIDATGDRKRCARYGYSYRQDQRKRRIFFGTMVADDEFDVVRMHAAEIYGIYHVVSLVESNTTFSNTPRKMRFADGTEGNDLIFSGIFGSQASVYLDLYLGDAFGSTDLNREQIQREAVLKRWKKAGMQPDDVGIIADMDETYTRDYLRAVQICDIPQLRRGQSCRAPRIRAEAIIFESSPECVSERRFSYHPDLMVGECIDGIGDPKGRPTPLRAFKDVYGQRREGWGSKGLDDYPDEVIKSNMYPLSNNADFRYGAKHNAASARWTKFFTPWFNNVFGWRYATGYHFHNFFSDLSTLRRKYRTYGHPVEFRVSTFPLSNIHQDLDLMVRCARGLPNSANPGKRGRYQGGFNGYIGTKPIFFLDEIYRKARHAHLQQMLVKDEELLGSKYPRNQSPKPRRRILQGA